MRAATRTQKVKTPFGSMYVHVEFVPGPDGWLRPAGGWISDPGKEPESQVARLVACLSAALDAALCFEETRP